MAKVNYKSLKKFKSHGPEIRLIKFSNQSEITQLPKHYIEEAIKSAKSETYSGYSFYPVAWSDKRKRKVPLDNIMQGVKIFCDTPRDIDPKIELFENNDEVLVYGGVAIVNIKSRSEDKIYEIRLTHFPVKNNNKNRYIIPYSLILNMFVMNLYTILILKEDHPRYSVSMKLPLISLLLKIVLIREIILFRFQQVLF
ncbi:MAG: hypothetical protein PHE43_04285 [Candidatus Nanoarchaeia archaeon]|nr:hypothetical protein [Candidatus Nanoarchaeia archaeon]